MEKFLGLVTYIRTFISARAELLEKLQATIERTLNKKKKIKGQAKAAKDDAQAQLEAKAAFNTLKELITSDPVMVNPNYDEPIEIYTDASEYGIGGVLKQKHGIIAYYDKIFKENKKKWSIPKKELFTILKTIQSNLLLLKIYTPGQVIVKCDNEGVVKMLNSTTRGGNPPILKDALALYGEIVSLGIEVKHVKGKENTIVDALS